VGVGSEDRKFTFGKSEMGSQAAIREQSLTKHPNQSPPSHCKTSLSVFTGAQITEATPRPWDGRFFSFF
jgi:hypothetical protein